jgi:hypothetical protein
MTQINEHPENLPFRYENGTRYPTGIIYIHYHNTFMKFAKDRLELDADETAMLNPLASAWSSFAQCQN